MIVHKVTQIFSAVAGNCFFVTTKIAKLHFPSAQIVMCYHQGMWKTKKKKKSTTQTLQEIHSGKTTAGILQAVNVAFTNIFPDLTNL